VSKKDLLLARLIEIAHSVEHSGHGLRMQERAVARWYRP
jgi:hypothetical protein